jgi:hypothetical protein
MKITVEEGLVKMSAENQAELLQIEWVKNQLERHWVKYGTRQWNTCDLTIHCQTKEK